MLHTSNLSPELSALIDTAIRKSASDIHVVADAVPAIRIDGQLLSTDGPRLDAATCDAWIGTFIGPSFLNRIRTNRKELDFSFTYGDQRFRANVFYQKCSLSMSLRLLPSVTRTMADLGVPVLADRLLDKNQGLVIVAGPTGHGKSTTLAAMVDRISRERRGHIITIEDPIEYVFEHKKSIVSQREVGVDTPSFGSALRSALREDPDVILVGEMRDLETMQAALQLAETGHLVLTTLHTNSAAQTADRIIDEFPPHQQAQVRVQLAEVLLGILSQRLMPKISGGRVLATELLIANPAVRALIREGKTHQINNVIQTSASDGMMLLDRSLADLVKRGEITMDDALAWSLDPKSFKLQVY